MEMENLKNSMNYKCNFPDKHDKATTGKIICKINGTGISLDNDLKIYFDLIYLQEKNIYIVNQNSKKEFILNNIQCPLFSFDQSTALHHRSRRYREWRLRTGVVLQRPGRQGQELV